MSNIFTKDPNEVLDYAFDWTEWLGDETIASSVLTVPAGITLVDDSNTDTVVNLRLSGGTHNVDYEILDHIITNNGQESERTIIIQVRHVETQATVLVITPGGATSNSYASLAEAKTYFSRKPYTESWDNATDERREDALLAATARLDQLDFIGLPVLDTVDEEGVTDGPPYQALKWPRMLNTNGDLIRNYASDVIPQVIKNATCEMAIKILAAIDAGLTGIAAGSEALDEVDLGPIKLKYGSGSASAETLSIGTLTTDYTGLPLEVARLLKGLRLWTVVA